MPCRFPGPHPRGKLRGWVRAPGGACSGGGAGPWGGAALVQNKIALSANVNLFHSGILPKTIKIITSLLVDGWTVDHFT